MLGSPNPNPKRLTLAPSLTHALTRTLTEPKAPLLALADAQHPAVRMRSLWLAAGVS